MRVIRYLVVRIEMDIPGKGVHVDEVINDCDYNFTSKTKGATIIDTEVLDTYDHYPEEG